MKGNCRAALCHPTRRADRSQCERSMSPPSHSPRAPRGVRGGAWGGGHKAESPQVWGGDGEGARCAHPPPSSHPRSPPHPAPVSMQGSSRSAPPAIPMLLFYGVRHTHTHVCTRVHEGGGQRARGCAQSAMHGSGSAVSIAQPCVRRTPHTAPPLCSPACTAGPHTRVCNAQTELWGGGGWMCVGGGAVLGVTAEGPAALRVPPPIWFAGGGADGRSHRMERRGRRAAVTLDPHHPPTHSTAAAATTGGGRAVWGGRSPRSLSCHPPRGLR